MYRVPYSQIRKIITIKFSHAILKVLACTTFFIRAKIWAFGERTLSFQDELESLAPAPSMLILYLFEKLHIHFRENKPRNLCSPWNNLHYRIFCLYMVFMGSNHGL
jgi:hypothetical protein